MNIFENFPLTDLNTFGFTVQARYGVTVSNESQVLEVLETSIAKNNPILILGGGSNVVFTKDYPGLVILNKITGIEIKEENNEEALVSAGGGVIWQNLVNFALELNLGGIENLSLIPGLVGAAPIQNIGAYGVELKDVFEYLEAIEINSGKLKVFTKEACAFGYRESIFKHQLKEQYIITKVMLKLSKHPQLKTSYGTIGNMLSTKGIEAPTIRDISNVVNEIRQSKLPDPTKLGNAGSFFKNPIIDKIDYEGLKLEFSGIPGYPKNNHVKVPAAWLIEQCGWKGKRVGNVGVHDKQPLVLVNYGGGTGNDLVKLAKEIQQSVATKFGIELEPEPRII